MKLKKIDYIIIKDYKKLKSKLNKNKVDDIEKFCINKKQKISMYTIRVLLEIFGEQEQASYKCIKNICDALQESNNIDKKLKALAYLKLAYRFKFNYNYDFMSKVITTNFITLFDDNENNKDIKNLIFNYTLVQFILRLL